MDDQQSIKEMNKKIPEKKFVINQCFCLSFGLMRAQTSKRIDGMTYA